MSVKPNIIRKSNQMQLWFKKLTLEGIVRLFSRIQFAQKAKIGGLFFLGGAFIYIFGGTESFIECVKDSFESKTDSQSSSLEYTKSESKMPDFKKENEELKEQVINEIFQNSRDSFGSDNVGTSPINEQQQDIRIYTESGRKVGAANFLQDSVQNDNLNSLGNQFAGPNLGLNTIVESSSSCSKDVLVKTEKLGGFYFEGIEKWFDHKDGTGSNVHDITNLSHVSHNSESSNGFIKKKENSPLYDSSGVLKWLEKVEPNSLKKELDSVSEVTDFYSSTDSNSFEDTSKNGAFWIAIVIISFGTVITVISVIKSLF